MDEGKPPSRHSPENLQAEAEKSPAARRVFRPPLGAPTFERHPHSELTSVAGSADPTPGINLTTTKTTFVRAGPLPDPDTLAGYAAIAPDLVDRLVSMAERQAAHRQQLEKS